MRKEALNVDNMGTKLKLTQDLEAPKKIKDFNKEWARKILVDYLKKIDPEWLLSGCLKVLDVVAKENPHPGMLSNSYVVDISYTQGAGSSDDENDEMTVESWFAKIPKSTKTFVLDEMEVFMYEKLLPLLQAFCAKACNCPTDIQMPIPIMFHCVYDEDNPQKNILVMENLRDQGYKALRPETCGLVFMRAAMTSLASVHAAAYAYQTALGGALSFLSRFPLIKEDNMPKAKLMKPSADELLEPYLEYMGLVAPDIAPQIAFLKKFHPFLLGVFHDIQTDKELWKLKIMVHGDSKIDNFMFKKNSWTVEEEFMALIIDWQGVAYDLVSGDLMWSLYGFFKNLPDKNSTVDTFMDYSIGFYHKELMRFLKLLHVDMDKLNLPEDQYDATQLIKKGFLFDFLKSVLLKPILTMKGKDILKTWYADKTNIPVPDEKEIFKSGTSFVNYIHLQITIATEIGVFHDLAPLCIQAMKEAMFGNINNLKGEDDEEEEEEIKEEPKEPVDLLSVLAEAQVILNANKPLEKPLDDPSDDNKENQDPDLTKQTNKGDESITAISNLVDPKHSNIVSDESNELKPTELSTTTTSTTATDHEIVTKAETKDQDTQTDHEEPTAATSEPVEEQPVVIELVPEPVVKIVEKVPVVNKHFCLWSAPPPPRIPPPKLPESTKVTGTKRKKKTGGKKVKKQELQKGIETKIQELKGNMEKTKITVLDLTELMKKSEAEFAGENVELRQAVEHLTLQVQNFHQTCIDEVKQALVLQQQKQQ